MNRRSFLARGLGTVLVGLAGCPRAEPVDPTPEPLPLDPTLEWLRRYGVADTHEDFQTLVATRDGGFLAGGAQVGSEYAAYLVRTDENGEERWRWTLADQPVRDVLETPDGGFILVVGPYNAGRSELVALTGNGTTRWHRNPTTSRSARYELTDLVPSHDGGYLAAGTHMETVETTADYGSERRSPAVVAVTSDGRLRWEHVFTAPDILLEVDGRGNRKYGLGMERANDIVRVDDGYLLLCATSEEAPYVRRLDSAGTEVWRRYYGRGYNGSLWSITRSPDGFVLAGIDAGGVEGTDLPGAWLLAIDEDGESQWSYVYQFGAEGTHADATFSQVVTDAVGSPVVTGTYHPDGFGNRRSRPMLARFDPSGTEVRWVRQYGERGGKGKAVVRTGDGSVILAGSLNEPGPWTDALLLDAGRPTESNLGPVRHAPGPTEPTPGE